MTSQKRIWSLFSGGMLILVILLVPALVVYDLYIQWTTPSMDFYLDRSDSSTVSYVIQGGSAEKAGLLAGDVILSVDDIPLQRWHTPQIGRTHLVMIARQGNTSVLPVPGVRLMQMNILPLVSAIFTSLVFWGTGLFLLIRKFWNKEIRLIFLLFQIIPAAMIFPVSFQIPWVQPFLSQIITKSAICLLPPVFLSFTLSHPYRPGKHWQRLLGSIQVMIFIVFCLWGWLTDQRWGQPMVILFTSTVFALASTFLYFSYQYRAKPESRRRIRVALFCFLSAGSPFLLLYMIPRVLGSAIYLPVWIACLIFAIAPTGYLLATLYFNLYGIDRLINRTLVYVILSAGIFAIYLVPYGLFYRFLPPDIFTQLVIVFSLTIWIGWTFDWLRSHAQKLVDRIVYGGWYDFPNVVETISNALARSNTREKVRHVLTVDVPRMMRLTNSALWIHNTKGTISAFPALNSSFRFQFKTDIPALWTVDSHSDGDDLSEIDHRILNTLAQQAEIALNNALAIETLQTQLDEIRTSREILAHTQRQLLRSREEERSRLARDLHDSPIQSLVGMNIQVGLLSRHEGLDDTTRNSLSEMRTEIRQLSDELRQICADLRPPMLDTLGLSSALHSLIVEWSKQTGINTRMELCEDAVTRILPGEITVNIFRVAQEALSNIAKHAHARNIIFTLSMNNGDLSMSIEDDGVGFSPPDTLQSLTAHNHFGLAGMRERINLIGGEWSVESIPQKGTIVRVVLKEKTNHAK